MIITYSIFALLNHRPHILCKFYTFAPKSFALFRICGHLKWAENWLDKGFFWKGDLWKGTRVSRKGHLLWLSNIHSQGAEVNFLQGSKGFVFCVDGYELKSLTGMTDWFKDAGGRWRWRWVVFFLDFKPLYIVYLIRTFSESLLNHS